MAQVWATIKVEVEIDDEILENEYNGDAFIYASDAVSVDMEGGRYLIYWVEEVDTDY